MPGLLNRRLKVLIDHGLARVVIATSTLSEGVNMPVTYLLIPSVYRATEVFTIQEFANLIGRAGRPGVSSEGHVLVVLAPGENRQRRGYAQLLTSLSNAVAQGAAPPDAASSALSQLLNALERAWRAVAGVRAPAQQFETWLEQTAVMAAQGVVSDAVRYLDSLDSFLLTAIEEVEEIRGNELPAADLEAQLIRIWQRSYAFAAARDEERLRNIWLRRGRVIKQRYPDAAV